MAGRAVKKCYGCKQEFRSEELVYYASPTANTGYNYCPKCLAEKQARERFSYKVCSIFGLKAPGPRIWTERKRLYEKYGYLQFFKVGYDFYCLKITKMQIMYIT